MLIADGKAATLAGVEPGHDVIETKMPFNHLAHAATPTFLGAAGQASPEHVLNGPPPQRGMASGGLLLTRCVQERISFHFGWTRQVHGQTCRVRRCPRVPRLPWTRRVSEEGSVESRIEKYEAEEAGGAWGVNDGTQTATYKPSILMRLFLANGARELLQEAPHAARAPVPCSYPRKR